MLRQWLKRTTRRDISKTRRRRRRVLAINNRTIECLLAPEKGHIDIESLSEISSNVADHEQRHVCCLQSFQLTSIEDGLKRIDWCANKRTSNESSNYVRQKIETRD